MTINELLESKKDVLAQQPMVLVRELLGREVVQNYYTFFDVLARTKGRRIVENYEVKNQLLVVQVKYEY